MSEVLAADIVWRLEDLYSGVDDPRIKTDQQGCLEEASAFAGTYRGKVGDLSPAELAAAVERFEILQERAQKILAFSFLNFSTNTQDPKGGGLLQAAQEFYSRLTTEVLFFELEWIQLEEDTAVSRLKGEETAHYRHYLDSIRRFRPHTLSEPEEKLLAEKEPAGASAWHTLFDKIFGHLQFGEKKRTESEVLSDLHNADRGVREAAAKELTGGLDSMLHVVTHVFNTVLLDKAINDRVRSYPHWLASRNLANEAPEETVQALIEAVTGNYELVARYYGLKKRLLGYDTLYDYDRYAPLPQAPESGYSWDEARDMVLNAYSAFSPDMAGIAGQFFDSRWIHAPALPGKRGGAYSHSTVPSAHPYVFMNFTGKKRDVMTLAHELGHGVHQYLARQQGLFNAQTPLTTAETASVFGEMLVFRHMLGAIGDPKSRLALLCHKIEDTFATIFRQVSMNRFEDAIHNTRRDQGELSAEDFSALWMKTQRRMFGDSVELLDHYGIWWSYIPHFIHSPGYVYAYAFGELLVFALYKRYQEEGSGFVPLYLELLASGGKDSPENLLRPLGIDLTDPGFWSNGLHLIGDMVAEAEREAQKAGY